MIQTDIRPETLNAYVDGELSRGDEASIARAAVDNPAIAAQIATLREMKAAVVEFIPERNLKLPVQDGFPLGRIVMAVAATIAVLAVTTTLYLNVWIEPVETRWATFLQKHHTAWSFQKHEAGVSLVSARGAAKLLPLDLKSARLTFTGFEEMVFSGRRILRTGYEGTRGCRVSLYVFPAGIALDRDGFSPSLLFQTWEIKQDAFVLMADGMAKIRFNGLARAVEKALRSGQELDSGTRLQLAQARLTSPPCRA